jgi:hypothetical protein
MQIYFRERSPQNAWSEVLGTVLHQGYRDTAFGSFLSAFLTQDKGNKHVLLLGT